MEMEGYWLWLCSLPGISYQQRTVLLSYFTSPKGVFEATEEDIRIWRRSGCQWIERVQQARDERQLEEVARRLREKRARFVSRQALEYPERLRTLPDAPHGLFYRGALPGRGGRCVAVVGARACSAYGVAMARELGRGLAAHGYHVISGLASGIDGTAQRAALEAGGQGGGGTSFGVLGCGVDLCYPRENYALYEELIGKGGLLSEYPCGTAPCRHHFPQRNRLISGLADVVVVVEARRSSGSLITANLALDQGREVYAVPGRSVDALSYGCNKLIEQGAGLVLSVEEFLEELDRQYIEWGGNRCGSSGDRREGSDAGHEERTEGIGKEGGAVSERRAEMTGKKEGTASERRAGMTEKKESATLSPQEQNVLERIEDGPVGIDALAGQTGLPVSALQTVLLSLQLQDQIEEWGKNQFIKKR